MIAPSISTSYSERAYFDGEACAHCAARDENQRLRRIARFYQISHARLDRRRGGRSI